MILSNILLGALVLFFGIRLFFAVRETKKARPKIRLFSKETGEVVELNLGEDAVRILNAADSIDFKERAKFIFLRVVDAFAKGRVSDVKHYLNDKVLPVFQKAVADREAKGQKMEFSLIGFKEIKLLSETADQKVVAFTTEQVNLLRDKDNKIIEGDPLYVATVSEEWTFTRKNENVWVVSGIRLGEAHFA